MELESCAFVPCVIARVQRGACLGQETDATNIHILANEAGNQCTAKDKQSPPSFRNHRVMVALWYRVVLFVGCRQIMSTRCRIHASENKTTLPKSCWIIRGGCKSGLIVILVGRKKQKFHNVHRTCTKRRMAQRIIIHISHTLYGTIWYGPYHTSHNLACQMAVTVNS